jgi:hypothetical protein
MKENKKAEEIYKEKRRDFAIPVWHMVMIVAESCGCYHASLCGFRP